MICIKRSETWVDGSPSDETLPQSRQAYRDLINGGTQPAAREHSSDEPARRTQRSIFSGARLIA